eukprot:9502438-Pyramimonas_sp.AAC.2
MWVSFGGGFTGEAGHRGGADGGELLQEAQHSAAVGNPNADTPVLPSGHHLRGANIQGPFRDHSGTI